MYPMNIATWQPDEREDPGVSPSKPRVDVDLQPRRPSVNVISRDSRKKTLQQTVNNGKAVGSFAISLIPSEILPTTIT